MKILNQSMRRFGSGVNFPFHCMLSRAHVSHVRIIWRGIWQEDVNQRWIEIDWFPGLLSEIPTFPGIQKVTDFWWNSRIYGHFRNWRWGTGGDMTPPIFPVYLDWEMSHFGKMLDFRGGLSGAHFGPKSNWKIIFSKHFHFISEPRILWNPTKYLIWKFNFILFLATRFETNPSSWVPDSSWKPAN